MQIIQEREWTAVRTAVKIVQSGGILVFPTDTVYGLGVNAQNAQAIKNLNLLKERKGPISVLAKDHSTALSWANIDEFEMELIKAKLGGSTTVIFPVHPHIVHPSIMGPNDTLGVRIPDHEFCQHLAEQATNPVTTTSVNKHGQPPLNDPREISARFENQIDLLIDGGNLGNNKSSSVYKLHQKQLLLIRK